MLLLVKASTSIPSKSDFDNVQIGMNADEFSRAYPFATTAWPDPGEMPEAAAFFSSSPDHGSSFSGQLYVGGPGTESIGVLVFVNGRLDLKRTEKQGAFGLQLDEMTKYSLSDGIPIGNVVEMLPKRIGLRVFPSPMSWAVELKLPKDAQFLKDFTGELSDSRSGDWFKFRFKRGQVVSKDSYPATD